MESLKEWRKFFKDAGTDICSLIEYAILVAASDCPNEFRKRRDRIAETLYAPRFLKCCDHDYVTLTEPGDEIIDCGIQNSHGKDNEQINRSSDEIDANMVSNCINREAEALIEEIEEESQVLKEVFMIKDILANPDKSDGQLHNCLKRLESMKLTIETLQATEIGKQVNRLGKHNSKEIRSKAKRLISGWKELLDEWLKTTGNVAAAGSAVTVPDSVSPATADDENGLPWPPLDEGIFLATQSISIELSQMFNGMDDDGSFHVAKMSKNDGDEKKCTVERPDKIKQPADHHSLRMASSPCGKQETSKERGELKRNAQIQAGKDYQGHRVRSSSRIIPSSGLARHIPVRSEGKRYEDIMLHHPDLNRSPTKPVSFPLQNQKSKSSEDASVKVNLEASKRRLREGYQQVENAKKQRKIQVIKQGHGRRVSQHHRQRR